MVFLVLHSQAQDESIPNLIIEIRFGGEIIYI